MKYILAISFCVSMALYANAQKEQQVQQGSVRAPENVKIDGKLDEWPNPYLNATKTDGYLNAYNSTNRIYYTIANDDNNLYVVIRGLGTRVARKSLSGGFTITLSHAIDKKNRAKAADNVIVNFPMPIDEPSISKVLSQFAGNTQFYNEEEIYPANYPFIKQLDSIQSITNALITPLVKEIKVKGVKELPDTLLSVYNETGIRAVMQFIWRQPVYEIAIPLKYLKLNINKGEKFSYNIKLNLRAPDPRREQQLREDYPIQVEGGISYGQMDSGQLFMMSATDFWGEYTLVKK